MSTETTTNRMEPAPGRHVTRRLTDPQRMLQTLIYLRDPDCNAEALAECHNAAVRAYGSDRGGWHAYDYVKSETVGVFSGAPFPKDTVVTPLAWGQIDARIAQRTLEYDGR